MTDDTTTGPDLTKAAAHPNPQVWKMAAKAAGYPLCVECREPISKGAAQREARRDGLCRFCRELNAKLAKEASPHEWE